MSIKDKYKVMTIKTNECKEWLLYKHYAKRIPPIQFAFGLFDIKNTMEGICTLSIPASRFNLSLDVYELNRLVSNDNLPKNTLSYFVSKVLKKIPTKKIIVSYADKNQNHHGYIYQATNWIYTGFSTVEKKIIVNGKELHRRTLYDTYGTSSIDKLKKKGLSIEQIEQYGKHRYFYILDNKKNRKKIFQEIKNKYGTMPYPKGDNKRYDASYNASTQQQLF
tara:strand:+ start:289 stop:951 length:663 start_codon:yes stop_codon:yes gene_type:complete